MLDKTYKLPSLLILLILIFGAAHNAFAKVNQKIDLDFPSVEVGRDHASLKKALPAVGNTAEDNQHPFFLKPDLNHGRVLIEYPVQVAPGIRGLTPDVALILGKWQGDKAAPRSIEVSGLQKIIPCEGSSQGFCLGRQPFKAIKADGKVVSYYLNQMPGVRILKTREGWLFQSLKGVSKKYERLQGEEQFALTLVTDPYGNFIRYRYNVKGRLTEIRYGASGAKTSGLKSLKFEYDASNANHISRITSQVAGRVFATVDAEYDTNGYPIEITQCAEGFCKPAYRMKWQEDGYLQSATRGKHLSVKFAYEKSGGIRKLVSREILLKGDVLEKQSITYHGNQINISDDEAKSGKYQVFGTGALEDLLVEEGQYSYSQVSNALTKKATKSYRYKILDVVFGSFVVLEQIRFETKTRAEYNYDHLGRLTEVKSGLSSQIIHYKYNGNDPFTTKENADLISKIVERNPNEREISGVFNYTLEGPRVQSRLLTISDGKQQLSTLSWEYDRFGNVVSYEDGTGLRFETTYETEFHTYPKSLRVVSKDHTEKTRVTFDPITGRQIDARYADGSWESQSFNAFGELLNRDQYIVDPQVEKNSQTTSEITENITTERLDNGNRVQRFEKIFKENGKPYQKSVIVKTVDPAGRLIGFNTARYNENGESVTRTELEQSFDKGGRALTLSQDGIVLQQLRADKAGQIVFEKSGGYGATSYEYDDSGKVIAVIRGGQRIALSYDKRGRLIRKQLPDERVYELSYDQNFPEKIAKVLLPSGKEIHYQFGKDSLTSKRQVIFPHPFRKGVFLKSIEQFSYENDQLKTLLFANGNKLGYEYDQGRLSSIKWLENPHATWALDKREVATYHPAGSDKGYQLEKRFGNGVEETFDWNEKGRLQSIRASGVLELFYKSEDEEIAEERIFDSALAQKRNFAFDASGRLKSWSESDGLSQQAKKIEEVIKDLKKDDLGNIIETSKPGVREAFLHKFDVENKLIQSQNNRTKVSYDYDHMGTRLEKSVTDGDHVFYLSPSYQLTFEISGQVKESLIVWDPMGQIARFDRYLNPDEVDAMIIGGGDHTLGQKVLNEAVALSQLASQNPEVAFLSLTALMLLAFAMVERVNTIRPPKAKASQSINTARALTTVTTILGFGFSLISPTAMAMQASLGKEIIPVTFFHHDVRGSVVATSDANGTRGSVQNYNPYGVVNGGDAKTRHDIRFAGMTYDFETGLYYIGARYYDPASGVFLSPDPKRVSNNPYEYADGNPVRFVDSDGRMPHEPITLDIEDDLGIEMQRSGPSGTSAVVEDLSVTDAIAVRISESENDGSDTDDNSSITFEEVRSPLDWVRYPSMWRLFFGYTEGLSPPERQEIPDAPTFTDDDAAEYNAHVRGGYMQGWTRLGGFTQALGSALLLTFFNASRYEYDDGSYSEAGFIRDFTANFMLLLTFIGFSYGYSGNEADYWAGVQRRGATEQDYWLVSARRMAWKVSFQLVTFPFLFMASNAVRGYPSINEEDPNATDYGNYFGYTLLRLLPYSLLGNMALLPFFALFKEPSAGFDDAITEVDLDRYGPVRRQLVRVGVAYRDFANRKGFWEESFPVGSFNSRLQYSWYWLNMLQLHFWFAIGSCGYYGGMATMVGTVPGFTEEKFLKLWRANAILLSLCPPVSLLNGINYWHRKSFTLIRKRSALTPRTSGILYRILGPTEGLRIAKFDDTSYIDARDWYPKLLELREAQSDRATEGDTHQPPEEHLGFPTTGEPAP